MSGFFKPRNLAILGAAGGGAILFASMGKHAPKLETPGVKAIGDRWSSGGGTDVHTPGVATTRGKNEGNASDTMEKQENPKGLRSEHYKDNHSAQRLDGPSAFDKAYNKTGK